MSQIVRTYNSSDYRLIINTINSFYGKEGYTPPGRRIAAKLNNERDHELLSEYMQIISNLARYYIENTGNGLQTIDPNAPSNVQEATASFLSDMLIKFNALMKITVEIELMFDSEEAADIFDKRLVIKKLEKKETE